MALIASVDYDVIDVDEPDTSVPGPLPSANTTDSARLLARLPFGF